MTLLTMMMRITQSKKSSSLLVGRIRHLSKFVVLISKMFFNSGPKKSFSVSTGFFFIIKDIILRIKEIIITAGGENVAPTNIEEEIKSELPEVRTHTKQNQNNQK